MFPDSVTCAGYTTSSDDANSEIVRELCGGLDELALEVPVDDAVRDGLPDPDGLVLCDPDGEALRLLCDPDGDALPVLDEVVVLEVVPEAPELPEAFQLLRTSSCSGFSPSQSDPGTIGVGPLHEGGVGTGPGSGGGSGSAVLAFARRISMRLVPA
jgi:hypothetical protein